MGSLSTRSWQESASESIFTVNHTPNDVQSNMDPGVASDIQTREVKRKNPKPCSRCSDMRKKCDTSPPYSLAKCRECTKANIPTCPPHRPRRSEASSHPSISPNVASPNLLGPIGTTATPIGFTVAHQITGAGSEPYHLRCQSMNLPALAECPRTELLLNSFNACITLQSMESNGYPSPCDNTALCAGGYTQECQFRLNESESENLTDEWNLILPTLLAPAFGPAYLPTQ